MGWQLQEAKQRFSELVRRALSDGPQVVTRHGEDVAVLLSMEEYRRITSSMPDLKGFLRSGPRFDDLDIPRSVDSVRPVELPNETGLS